MTAPGSGCRVGEDARARTAGTRTAQGIERAGAGVTTANRQPEVSEEERAELERTWASRPGFFGWFTHVTHKSIGARFIGTAFVFFLLAGLLAGLMRIQLAFPEHRFMDADLYNQVFTMHGTTMMFFFAVPMMEGLAIYLVPLMLGTRDMAFPRLNAFGYYVYLIAGVVLFGAFFLGMAPDAGWFNYVPLAGPEFSPGIRIDFWATMITFIEVSALVAAVEIIVTIFKQRPPGMSLHRMPVFVWAMLVMSFMIVFAMPAVITGSVMLALERTVGTHFFNPSGGGDPLLWQHLFWFFGHPEVYIILIPGLGIVSSIVATSARRPLFGYLAIVLSLVAIGIVSFGLWVHHMFATGLPPLGLSFFTAASVMIGIPSGVQIFCWIATLWSGRPQLRAPLLFVLGFLVIFVVGGITGIMTASVPLDLQVHDTYFVVAHFHYVLIGGAVFPLFGGFHYWFPKVTGRMLSERLGIWSAGLMFLGTNLAFFPMHILGMMGMPRRIYTYLVETGWGPLNLFVSLGAGLIVAGVAVFLSNAARSRRHGERAGPDPWGADTLEWSTASPPPSYNFARVPAVTSRWARWEPQQGRPTPVVVGLRSDRREVLTTSVLDAEPERKLVLPGPSYWPLALALACTVAFLGVIWSTWAVPIGGLLAFGVLAAWQWPRREERTPPWVVRNSE